MANFEVFLWSFSSSTNSKIVRCGIQSALYFCMLFWKEVGYYHCTTKGEVLTLDVSLSQYIVLTSIEHAQRDITKRASNPSIKVEKST